MKKQILSGGKETRVLIPHAPLTKEIHFLMKGFIEDQQNLGGQNVENFPLIGEYNMTVEVSTQEERQEWVSRLLS